MKPSWCFLSSCEKQLTFPSQKAKVSQSFSSCQHVHSHCDTATPRTSWFTAVITPLLVTSSHLHRSEELFVLAGIPVFILSFAPKKWRGFLSSLLVTIRQINGKSLITWNISILMGVVSSWMSQPWLLGWR